MPGDVDSLKVEIAGFKGEVLTELKHLSSAVQNLTQGMQAFITHREVNEILERLKEAHTGQELRLKRLEDNQAKAVWAIISAWLAGISLSLAGIGFSLKVFGGH